MLIGMISRDNLLLRRGKVHTDSGFKIKLHNLDLNCYVIIFVLKHWLSAHQQLIFISRKTLQLTCIKDKVYLFRDLA